MRKLLVFLVVVVALAALADTWLRGYASERASAAIGDALPVAGRVDVEIESFPFIVAALAGEFDAITLHSKRLRTDGGAEVRGVRARLEDVEVSLVRAVAGRPTELAWRRGGGSLRLPVADLLPAGMDASVVPEAVAVEGNALDVAGQTVPLPAPLPGMRYRSARIRGDTIRATFDLDASAVDVP